jgi:hypothetical protein
MTDPTPASYSLVPWVRRGLASLVTGTPTKNYVTLPVAVDVNGTAVPAKPIRLLGPGDITSMDAAAVIRTDPRDGADAFEPNYLAMVELALPDLPWLFTPAAPVGGRLRPWICLVVIADNDGIKLDVPPNGPAVLNLNESVAELPDLANVDAWAHAQVIGDNLSGDALNAALDGDTGARLGRLVCPRKLEPNRRYVACIVPTYRAGTHAGLEAPVDEQDLAPAWDANTSAPFQLPVYYYFRFQTGPGGDFASLAARITPAARRLDAGKRIVDVSGPGFGAAAAPGVTLEFEGALRAQGEPPTDWPPGAQVPYETQLRNALAPAAAADPVVAPPVYGRTQSGKGLPKDHDAPVWLGDLNLDPRMRAAAGAGVQIVQRDQEALLASAWGQLGEIRKANQLLRQAQLARGASASMLRRHLGAIAADGAYLQVTGPVHSRVSLKLGTVTFTLRGHVAASRLPVRALSATMRKLARPHGALGRQLSTGKPPQLVDRLNLPASAGPLALTAAGPVQQPRGMVALDDVSPDIQVAKMASSIPATAPGWITIADSPTAVASSGGTSVSSGGLRTSIGTDVRTDTGTGLPTDTGTDVRAGPDTGVGGARSVRLIDWSTEPDVPALLKGAHANLPAPLLFPTEATALKKMAQEFRTVAGPQNLYLNRARAPPPDLPSLGGSSTLKAARTLLQARLDPERTIPARFGARIPLGAGADPLQPLRIAPQFPQPMYSTLADLSPAWMLAGADKVPINVAVLLQTNPRFVEAFMVGLNEAMAGELLWREFPVGRTATYFQNFWGGAAPDVPPIDTFDASGKLGDHTADHATGGNLVLLIRADLFRRYPNTMVSAVQAQWSADGKTRQLGDTRKWPLFCGTIGTDLNFFGFDVVDARGVDSAADGTNAGWYFVLEEHVTEPRFGLEPETSTPKGNSWNDLSWSYAKLDRSSLNLDPTSTPGPRNGAAWGQGEPAAWGQGAAAMAYILMRRPVRMAMHGRALLAAAGT